MAVGNTRTTNEGIAADTRCDETGKDSGGRPSRGTASWSRAAHFHCRSGCPVARTRRLVVEDTRWLLIASEGCARAPERSRQALDQESMVGWATAEELAFGSILEDGIPIRLSGEDSERGTFSQRHAAFYDTETGQRIVRLQTLPSARAAFEVCNSPLSENAVVGFEFGFNIQKPEQLVIWEAPDMGTSPMARKSCSTSSLFRRGQNGVSGLRWCCCCLMGMKDRVRIIPAAVSNVFSILPSIPICGLPTVQLPLNTFICCASEHGALRQDPLPLIVLTPKGVLRDPRLPRHLKNLFPVDGIRLSSDSPHPLQNGRKFTGWYSAAGKYISNWMARSGHRTP